MNNMKKVLFIDRDGTILIEPPDEQVDSIKKMDFVPGAISALHKIINWSMSFPASNNNLRIAESVIFSDTSAMGLRCNLTSF